MEKIRICKGEFAGLELEAQETSYGIYTPTRKAWKEAGLNLPVMSFTVGKREDWSKMAFLVN